MEPVSTAVEKVISGIAAGAPPDTGGYVGEDGFMHCRICGGRTETAIKIKTSTGIKEKRVRCVCQCQRERSEKEAARSIFTRRMVCSRR